MTLYRGLPYDLPAGIDLYSTNYISGVAGDEVPARAARRCSTTSCARATTRPTSCASSSAAG